MPIVSEKPFTDGSKKGKGPVNEDLKRVEFETTPIMSTYAGPFSKHQLIKALGLCGWRFRVY